MFVDACSSAYQSFSHLFDDFCEFTDRFSSQHRDACLSEIRDSLEDGRCRQMATCMEDATPFVDTFHIDVQLFEEDADFLTDGKETPSPAPP